MADFCKQCSEDMFGPGHNDFEWAKDHLTEAQERNGYGISALCEGCGFTMVNRAGECITDCMLHHKTSDG